MSFLAWKKGKVLLRAEVVFLWCYSMSLQLALLTGEKKETKKK